MSADQRNMNDRTAGDEISESPDDRLLGLALREIHGQKPPDLSAQIDRALKGTGKSEAAVPCDSAAQEKTMNNYEKAGQPRSSENRRKFPYRWAIAIGLLAVVTLGLLVAINDRRENAVAQWATDLQPATGVESTNDYYVKSQIEVSENGIDSTVGLSEEAEPRLVVTPEPRPSLSTPTEHMSRARTPSSGQRKTGGVSRIHNKPARPPISRSRFNGRPGLGRGEEGVGSIRYIDSIRSSDYATNDLGNRQLSGPTVLIPQGGDGANVQPDEGTGPGAAGDRYDRIVENAFVQVTDHPLSTFSIDVDTAAYSIVRSHLLSRQTMPPPDAVRIEELVNYFAYQYEGPQDEGPQDEVPFAAHIEVAGCPWKAEHRLVRVALKGKEMDVDARPLSNLVFLIDVSGSMNQPNKLPLLKRGMKLLAEQLGENDRVAIVVYASAQGLALPSTSGLERQKILDALDSLQAGGSTNGGAGIELAYKIAQDQFIEGGVNRVLLCTDGDFNVGTTSTAALERMVEEKAKSGVFLTVMGFGHGNLNDAMMENISNKGNGNYAYIDNLTEARKVLVQQMTGTLVTIAKDVKIQIEFNPQQVAAYRQIGYENRRLAAQDFNDDKKDAGEIGAGHTVTALYEIVPAGQQVKEKEVEIPGVDPLKYQKSGERTEAAGSGEMLTLKVRYKQPDGEQSRKLEFPVKDDGHKFAQASGDFQFASAVASFGMLLRGSQYAGDATLDAVLEIGKSSQGEDKQGARAEFLEMVRQAKQLRP